MSYFTDLWLFLIMSQQFGESPRLATCSIGGGTVTGTYGGLRELQNMPLNTHRQRTNAITASLRFLGSMAEHYGGGVGGGHILPIAGKGQRDVTGGRRGR
jgi:hypothetical protein